jgi:hypothetical protein
MTTLFTISMLYVSVPIIVPVFSVVPVCCYSTQYKSYNECHTTNIHIKFKSCKFNFKIIIKGLKMFCIRGGMEVLPTASPPQSGNLGTPPCSAGNLLKPELAFKRILSRERKSETTGQSLKLLQLASSPNDSYLL